MAYFQRSGNMALLVAATVFTYGVGGVAYWLLKRNGMVCPSCGLSWQRARPLGPAPASGPHGSDMRSSEVEAGVGKDDVSSALSGWSPPPPPDARLPLSGFLRRLSGVVVGLAGLVMVVLSLVSGLIPPLVIGGGIALSGALIFGWGWTALRRRRQALLERTQRKVIHLAHHRGGRLTATDVATALDLGIPAAERILLSLDDGFRVRSEVTRDGILVFDFPEVAHQESTPTADVIEWESALQAPPRSAVGTGAEPG